VRLNEPGSVAATWHQTGMVYQEAGQPEAAENAYQESLAMKVQLGDVAGQTNTLIQLGTLYYGALDRVEDAATFFRRAADQYAELHDAVHEGMARNNLAAALHNLRRVDEARQEVHRAIECKEQFGHVAEPWTSWEILARIETDSGTPTAAAEARRKAIGGYLAYRRDGGENHTGPGRLVFEMTENLLTRSPAAAASFLRGPADDPELTQLRPFIQALQAIVAGSRVRSLADAPDLDYKMAAEILFLIETLEKPR
jgi:tetratricopeptide (TPR) repeat protein